MVRRELVGAAFQVGGNFFKILRALARAERAPGLQRVARCAHGGVDVLLGPRRNAAHHLSGAGVVHVDGFLAGRGDPLAADEKTISDEHGNLLG